MTGVLRGRLLPFNFGGIITSLFLPLLLRICRCASDQPETMSRCSTEGLHLYLVHPDEITRANAQSLQVWG